MSGVRALCLWIFLINGVSDGLCSSIQFLAREEGDSVRLTCRVGHTDPPPSGVYLKRSWLRRSDVLFQYERSEVTVLDPEFLNRTLVSGDPSDHTLNVSISRLRPSDTDRYHCDFTVLSAHSEDTMLRGDTEFFLLVRGVLDVERDLVNACVGGSVVLPCVPPVGDSSAVDAVVLKRQRGQQPMELLYHSKQTSWSSQHSVQRFQLNTAPGPSGISYSLTVGPLQPEDSGLYSCQLQLHGRPHSPSMGRQGEYVSVQGDLCSSSSHSTVIYALSGAVAVTLVLLLVFVLMQRGNRTRAKAAHAPAAPIYEDMAGLQSEYPKRRRSHTEEECSEYRNILLKNPCPENHYESPRVPPSHT